jgi:hypothetical protein
MATQLQINGSDLLSQSGTRDLIPAVPSESNGWSASPSPVDQTAAHEQSTAAFMPKSRPNLDVVVYPTHNFEET